MKKGILFPILILAFIAEIIALAFFAVTAPDLSQDTVAVNEIVQSVTQSFPSFQAPQGGPDYTVLDADGKVLFATKPNLSESLNEAIAHRDTILDVVKDGETVGKIIIFNDGAQTLRAQKRTAIIIFSVAAAAQCCACVLYAFYIDRRVVKPFKKLKGFAERVAGGNLDIPLEMDRRNLFGAFTESFDIMRSELKKARLAEAQAQQSKKELVAKLSHDIKTPVASIKAVSEVGLAVTENGKDRENYGRIIGKADQINTLVTNLFTATLEELQQLTVTPTSLESKQVKAMLENADYLRRAKLPDIPDCILYADGLRLQQVFDNIFANSYKYAKTEILVSARENGNYIYIVIEDAGGGVDESELPALKEKFRRGANAVGTEGAGLGLYISDYFMKEMHGELSVENGTRGLKVTIALAKI